MLVRPACACCKLISSTPAKDPLSGGGGGICGDSLDGSVGHDFLGELLLGLGEAGTGSPVLGVDLRGKGRQLGPRQEYKSASVNRNQRCSCWRRRPNVFCWVANGFLTINQSLKYRNGSVRREFWGIFSLWTYHFQEHDCQDGIHCEETSHHHHNHGNGQVWLEHADGGDPPTVRKRQTNVWRDRVCTRL